MRKFQIVPIRISLKGNKYAKSREIVSEDQLTSPAVELIAAGFIKEVFVEEEVTKLESEDPILKIAKDSEEVNDIDVKEKVEVSKEKISKASIADIIKPIKRK